MANRPWPAAESHSRGRRVRPSELLFNHPCLVRRVFRARHAYGFATCVVRVTRRPGDSRGPSLWRRVAGSLPRCRHSFPRPPNAIALRSRSARHPGQPTSMVMVRPRSPRSPRGPERPLPRRRSSPLRMCPPDRLPVLPSCVVSIRRSSTVGPGRQRCPICPRRPVDAIHTVSDALS